MQRCGFSITLFCVYVMLSNKGRLQIILLTSCLQWCDMIYCFCLTRFLSWRVKWPSFVPSLRKGKPLDRTWSLSSQNVSEKSTIRGVWRMIRNQSWVKSRIICKVCLPLFGSDSLIQNKKRFFPVWFLHK